MIKIIFLNCALLCVILSHTMDDKNCYPVNSETQINQLRITSDQEILVIACPTNKNSKNLIKIYGISYILQTRLENLCHVHWVSNKSQEDKELTLRGFLIDCATKKIIEPLNECCDNQNF